MDWEKLQQKDLPPPIVPTFPDGDDTANFPDSFTQQRADSFVAQEPRLGPADEVDFLYDQDDNEEADVGGTQAPAATLVPSNTER